MPPQAAPQSGQASTAVSPSLLPIPPYRVHLFEIGVAERLREAKTHGVSEAEVLATIRTERLALVTAITQENFRSAFASSYEQAHNAVMPAAAVSPEEARRATDEIIAHRVNDAQWLAQLVTQPAFIEKARSTTETKPTPYRLPREKVAEMVSRFAADGSSYGVDARVHNQQAMEGHRIGHLALAQVYAENGPLHAVLEQNLTQALGGDAATAKRLGSDWLEARRQPAIATADTLGVGGEVYEQVMQRSAAPTASSPAPAATIGTAAKITALAPLNHTTALHAIPSEHEKNDQQRAEDVIYTLNHALTCLSITDTLVAPAIGAMSEKWFGKRVEVCGHDHGPGDHHHGRDMHADQRSNELRPLWKRAGDWIIGEAVGDLGAVGFTVGVQRMFPGFMSGVRHTLEPVLGGMFRRGAERAAASWGEKNGLEKGDPAIATRAQELYQYEMNHLPQMAVWTGSSVGINYATMWGMNQWRTHRTGIESDFNLWKFTKGKSLGAAVTAGLVMGARALAPNAAHGWDQSAGKHVVVPLTKILGKPFGVRTEDVDKFNQKRSGEDVPADMPTLEGRVAQAPGPQQAAMA